MSKTQKKGTNKNTGADLLENTSTTASQLANAESWFNKNKIWVYTGIAAIVIGVGSMLGYNYIKQNQEQEAQEQMFPALYYLESDSLNLALKGDGNYPGFEEIAEDYSLSKAGNLANFYTGVAYLKQGEFKKAIASLEDFSASDEIIQGRAYALIGDANLELYAKNKKENKYLKEAASFYQKAANYRPNDYFTPGYLMKLALTQEQSKEYDKAIETYDKIINEYVKSQETANARKYKARLEAMQASK